MAKARKTKSLIAAPEPAPVTSIAAGDTRADQKLIQHVEQIRSSFAAIQSFAASANADVIAQAKQKLDALADQFIQFSES